VRKNSRRLKRSLALPAGLEELITDREGVACMVCNQIGETCAARSTRAITPIPQSAYPGWDLHWSPRVVVKFLLPIDAEDMIDRGKHVAG
jgi:hypothetical protein